MSFEQLLPDRCLGLVSNVTILLGKNAIDARLDDRFAARIRGKPAPAFRLLDDCPLRGMQMGTISLSASPTECHAMMDTN